MGYLQIAKCEFGDSLFLLRTFVHSKTINIYIII
jgi:hypothetical protein